MALPRRADDRPRYLLEEEGSNVPSNSDVHPRHWPAIAIAWLTAFVTFTVLALGFDVNGIPYGGWARTFGVLSVATIPLAISAGVSGPHLTRRRLGCAIAGLAIASAALALTVWHFGDAQSSSPWPSTLAWIGLMALLASGAALAVPTSRPDSSIR